MKEHLICPKCKNPMAIPLPVNQIVEDVYCAWCNKIIEKQKRL